MSDSKQKLQQEYTDEFTRFRNASPISKIMKTDNKTQEYSDAAIKEHAQTLDTKFLEKALNDHTHSITALKGEFENPEATGGFWAVLNTISESPKKVSSIEKLVSYVLPCVSLLTFHVRASRHNISEEFEVRIKRFKELWKNNGILAKDIAIVTGLAALTTYIGFRKLRASLVINYEMLQNTVLAIAHLLNGYDTSAASNAFKAEDQGKIMYLCYKLRKEIGHVPYEKQKQFLADVGRLESLQLSVSAKLRVIELMYKTYELLTPGASVL